MDRIDGIPHYVRIREEIRENLLSEKLKKGDRLPSEEELAAFYGVSRMTLRQGINDLIDEGLLYRRHGVGTFVSKNHLMRDHSRLNGFNQQPEPSSDEITEELLSASIVQAKAHVAKALGIEEGDESIRIITLRCIDGEPITIHDIYLPRVLFKNVKLGDIDAAMSNLWEFYSTHGNVIKNGIQRLEARQAEGEIAEQLKLESGAPILYKERTLYAEDGTPIEFLYCYNRGDMYSVTIRLQR